MDVAITKMSSKGQIVIPAEMREGMKEGDKILIIRSGDRIMMRRASTLDKEFEEDLEFARRTEDAIARYEKGQSKKMEGKDFLEELGRW